MSETYQTDNVERRFDIALKLVPVVAALIIGAVHAFGLGCLDKLRLPVNSSLSETIGFYCNGALRVLTARFTWDTFRTYFLVGVILALPCEYILSKITRALRRVPDEIKSELKLAEADVAKLTASLEGLETGCAFAHRSL